MACALLLSLNAAAFRRAVSSSSRECERKSLLRPFPARGLTGVRLPVSSFWDVDFVFCATRGKPVPLNENKGHLSCRMLR